MHQSKLHLSTGVANCASCPGLAQGFDLAFETAFALTFILQALHY